MNLSKIRDRWNRFTGDGAYPHELSFLLDIPLRRLIITPEDHADRLRLSSSHTVLEIGPGSGYFSIEVARRLTKGRLELFDIQPEMLEKIKKKARKAGLANIGYAVGDAASLPYPDETFDAVYMVTVLGEVKDPSSCIKNIARVLRPSGALHVTEQTGDADHIKPGALQKLMEEHGFLLLEKRMHKTNYTASYGEKTL